MACPKLHEKSEDGVEDEAEEAKALSLLILLKTASSHAPAQMIEDYSQHRVKHIVGWIYSSTMPVAYSICASCHHARWILRMDKLASYCCSVLAQADKPAAHPMLPGLANPRQPNIPFNCINCNLVNPQITGGWLQFLCSISQLYLGCHPRPSQQQNRALYPQNARPWLHSESSETNSKNIKSQKNHG